MSPQFRHVRVLRFLFRLAGQVEDMTQGEFLHRLVVGIANRYGASSCSVYRYGQKRAIAWAPVAPDLQELSGEERAYLRNFEGRLAQASMSKRERVSGLDLIVDGDLTDFLNAHFPQMDIFAFPLTVDQVPQGAIVIYLPEDASPLTELDIQAFMAMGEIVQVAEDDLCRGRPRLIREDERWASDPARRNRSRKRSECA